MRATAVTAAAVVALSVGCSSPNGTSPRSEPHTAPREPHASASAAPRASLPEQLVRVERAIADRRTTSRKLRAAGRRQQLLVRELAGFDAARERRVLAQLPAGVRARVAPSVAARHQLRSMFPSDPSQLGHELPAWRIVRPEPASHLLRYYHLAQRRTGVDWAFLAAINMIETDVGRISGTSTAGAQGPMQFLPATWRIYGHGGDIHDPHDAILAAGRLLAANGFAHDRTGALRHYNNSSAYARAVTLLAGVMHRSPREYLGYYQWRVFYLTSVGAVALPIGYDQKRPVSVRRWLAHHPHALVLHDG